MKMQIATIVVFILLFFFLLPLQNHAKTLHHHINTSNYTDQQSLIHFKSYIKSDRYGVLNTWNSTISLCKWRGVTCSPSHQRVASIDLGNIGLKGTIAPHIGNLSFLTSLDLSGNTFQGTIPTEIGNLIRLRTMNLSSNHLEGAIPPSLGLCKRLFWIDLSSNNLNGRIPSEFGRLSNLDAFTFSDNFLTGSIPQSFSNLSSVTNILLRGNSLTGSIPECLTKLPLLVNLDLSLNQLHGEIPPALFNMSSLIILALTLNRLSGVLPSDMFTKLTNLEGLYIGGNNFSGSLPVSLGNASMLVQVDMSRNNFIGQVPLLSNLPNIEVLSFDTNQLTSDGEHGWDFLTSLSNSTQLNVFSLAGNLLTGKLPSSVGNLSKQLSQFIIGGNDIEGNLPDEISQLVGLTLLSVESNSFSGHVPSSIGNLHILQKLYLHENNFSGRISESLANLTLLSEMNMKENYLNGFIPSNFGKLQHLEVLDLSKNMLTGTIPVEIFNIPNLALLLNLSFNSLSGHIPREIGNLKMIQAIDLSSNHFTGDIPSSIGECSSLENLNLSRNTLHAQIPRGIGDMKGLESIDLSLNNLSGEIPVSLSFLPYLQFLDLSMNQLEGPIPLKGIFINTSVVFLSGNSHLCGGLPKFNLTKCDLPKRKHGKRSKVKVIIALVVSLVAVSTLLVAILMLLSARKRRHQKNKARTGHDASLPQHEYKLYSYYDLKSATQNFSQQNLIGQGSYGKVYKAVFTDGIVAAVKVFNLDLKDASKSFMTECEALRNIRHRNLLKIISVCSSGDFKALILPFMTNGSLDQWIHRRPDSPEGVGNGLDLVKRFKIVEEIACGMEYLHHESGTPIVHCDLKPSNALLDEDMSIHIADFGIARLLNARNDQPTSSTLGLKGSIGYIAPEYGLGSDVSTRGDVYSFGIVLLEIFTGKKPTNEEFTGNCNLHEWVANAFPDNIGEILDYDLIKDESNSVDYDSVIAILEIGLKCSMNSPEERPTMKEVSLLIKNITAKLAKLSLERHS